MVTGIGDQFVTSTGLESLQPFVTILGVFRISRTSLSPLISEIPIDNATASLNGTRIDCASVEGMITTFINGMKII